ncbi:endonuclease/exonuclease/phosphatase family protein [uncultured Amnibacterium sp.]|uniref:endonuclease/exonuclease/phosphatase family protein n=1 Tax=uncultured Amnibacterium sp. TaxID=1631851 RepID=UPI0035C96684
MTSSAAMTSSARLMTWNVWWRFGPDAMARQPLILDTIRDAGADVIALEESWATAGETQAGAIADALGFHAVFAGPSLPPLPDVPEHPDQVGVDLGIALVSRWPVSAKRVAAMPSRHRHEAPVTLVATLDHPSGPLHVVATCLEWEPAYGDDRMTQSRFVADLATDPSLDGPAPVVVLGDLNAPAGSPFLRPLTDVLLETWDLGGGDPAAVTLRSAHPHAPLEAVELIDQRIDHVLYRPGRPGVDVEVSGARLAGDPVDGLHPSDHLAVLCDLTWRTR